MTEGAWIFGPECSGTATTIGDGTDNNNDKSGGRGGGGVILGNFSMGHANVSAVFSGEEYKYPLLLAIYSATFALGFVGNSVALWDFLWHRRYRSPSCVCLINLACADLLFVLSLPIRLFYYSRAAHVELPPTLCRISHYAFYVNMYGSIYLLACYSVMRYLAVARPMRAKELITLRRAVLACAAIWIFVLSSSAPLLVERSSEQGTKCFDLQKGSVSFLYKMNAFAAVVGCAMPFAVILLCYAGIWRSLVGGPETSASPSSSSSSAAAAASSLPPTLRLRASGGARAARRRRAARLMLAVVLVFVVCFVPYHALRTVYLHLRLWRGGDWVGVHKGLLAAVALTALNCVLDPLLYYFSGEIFRRRALAMWDSAVRLQSTRIGSGGAAGGTAAVVLPKNSSNNRGTASPGRAPSRVGKVATLDCPV